MALGSRLERCRSTASAGGVALGYTALACIYVFVLGQATRQRPDGAEDASAIEAVSCLSLIGLTTLGIFFLARAGFIHLARTTLALERSQTAFLASERHATVAPFTAAIAHDLNNVLTVINGVTEELQLLRSTEELPELTRELERASSRARELGEELFRVIRNVGEQEQAQTVDVVELVRELLEALARHVFRAEGPTLVAPPSLSARLYPTMVRQIVVNLVLNAWEATKGQGQIEVRLAGSAHGIDIVVEDDGPGIPEEHREQMFKAFYTTKPHGTGLGLMSIRACAERHGGSVELDEGRLGGACFRVRLSRLPQKVERPG